MHPVCMCIRYVVYTCASARYDLNETHHARHGVQMICVCLFFLQISTGGRKMTGEVYVRYQYKNIYIRI